MRSFETAVAHYPSTSVATHTATRRRTHLHCVTKKDAPPLRHEGTIVTDTPLLRHKPLLRRKPQQRNDAPLLRHETEVTIVSNEGKIVTDAPLLRHEPLLRRTPQQRIDAPPLRHDKRTNETAFAPTLQRHEHEHDPQDRNEGHEQRRQPLN